MQIRVCDRCRVEVPETAPAAGVRGVTLTPDLPASDVVKVPVDVTLALSVQAPGDLCPPCRRSAIVEYAAQVLQADGSADERKVLGARFVKVLKS